MVSSSVHLMGDHGNHCSGQVVVVFTVMASHSAHCNRQWLWLAAVTMMVSHTGHLMVNCGGHCDG